MLSTRIKGATCAALVLLLLACTGCRSAEPEGTPDGGRAYTHIQYLDKIGARPVGSEAHGKAKTYIEEELTRFGYNAEAIPFSVKIPIAPGTEAEAGDAAQPPAEGDAEAEAPAEEAAPEYQTIDGANIQALLPGKSEKIIVVMAHYDSDAGESHGCDDNASGVAVLLELAERFRMAAEAETDAKEFPCSILFLFTDAEENGLIGSSYYVNSLDEDMKDRIRCVINVDSVAVGDFMYVYGPIGPNGWIRERALTYADQLEIPLRTTDGSNPEFPKGTTGDWGDHVAFANANMPYCYFEATNWDLGQKDGYTQTEGQGIVFHTEKDTFAFIEESFPGRILTHMTQACRLVEALCWGIEEDK